MFLSYVHPKLLNFKVAEELYEHSVFVTLSKQASKSCYIGIFHYKERKISNISSVKLKVITAYP